MNHHRLSDLRADHGDLLETILTDSIAVLLHEGLVTLDTVAQDGMRVRASAGGGSFRRAASLEEAQRQAAAAIAEFPHADCRNRGLLQFRVRGLLKAKAQALWHALAFNFLRLGRLVCEMRKKTYLEVVMAS